MQTRSSQKRSPESSAPLVAHLQPRSADDRQTEPPLRLGVDFSHVDLFSHAPKRGPVQMKLTVGAPNDQYEQEADRVAEQVVSMPDSAVQPAIQRAAIEDEELQTKPIAATITPLVQRLDSDSDEDEDLQTNAIQRQERQEGEDEELQAKPIGQSLQRLDSDADDDDLQMKSAAPVNAPTVAPDHVADRIESSKGSGSPLPADVRAFVEPRFGVDFSQVRVHTGSESEQLNRAVGARAFTQGQDVFYGAANSPSDLALTAHELTHVVQQTGAKPLSIQRKQELVAHRPALAQTPLIQRDDPKKPGAPSQTAPPTAAAAGTPRNPVAAAMWGASAVQPVREAKELVDEAPATENFQGAIGRLESAQRFIDPLIGTYRKQGQETVARLLSSRFNSMVSRKLNLQSHIGGIEPIPVPAIGRETKNKVQKFKKDAREVASASPQSGSPAEKAAGRQAVLTMWNSSVVVPQSEISKSLLAPGAESDVAQAAHSKTLEIISTLGSIQEVIAEAKNQRTEQLLAVDRSLMVIQAEALLPHLGKKASPEGISVKLDALATEMEADASQL